MASRRADPLGSGWVFHLPEPEVELHAAADFGFFGQDADLFGAEFGFNIFEAVAVMLVKLGVVARPVFGQSRVENRRQLGRATRRNSPHSSRCGLVALRAGFPIYSRDGSSTPTPADR